MAKIILLCGKICSGKTTCAEQIRVKENAVVLSCDEAVLRLFGHYLGDDHERITQKVQKYLLDQAIKILSAGTSVVLDWGFWRKKDRDESKQFFLAHGYRPLCYYITVTDQVWRRNIQKRNRLVTEGKAEAFYVDHNLLLKLQAAFEEPAPDEIDQYLQNDW